MPKITYCVTFSALCGWKGCIVQISEYGRLILYMLGYTAKRIINQIYILFYLMVSYG
jgi:hypothetical protein